nr:MAG TPA: Baseplate wedge protein [Caudoviricetes sp.]
MTDHTYSQSEYFDKGVVKYTSRDYESIMKDFWDIVPKMTELWKPEADSDPGVVLGKFLASVADMLGVNLDWLANEIFAPSVSQRKNAEKLFGLIGYQLGWYTAARTEVTFTNNTNGPMELDFGFNGTNFSTLNAYTDITNQSRVITYNILPLTNKYGTTQSRSRRQVVSDNLNIFAHSDIVTIPPGKSVTRVAIEGELRSYSVSVEAIRKNNYIINIPSQHIDTTAIWIKAKQSKTSDDFLATQWVQCNSPAEFITPEPRFAVNYDSYSNAQIVISNYLDQMETYDNNSYLVVYWLDCSGVIGCVSENTLSNYLQAKPSNKVPDQTTNELAITNLSNTTELPHTNVVTGKSPETAKQAYRNSRNYINTWDSLITLPDFNRFLNREPGVDCGLVVDCQKAFDINLSIYKDQNLSASQKQKMYIDNSDFPSDKDNINWADRIDISVITTKSTHKVLPNQTIDQIATLYDLTPEQLMTHNGLQTKTSIYPGYILKIPDNTSGKPKLDFASNFKRYTAMCFAIHNDFKSTNVWGPGETSVAKIDNRAVFTKYRPSQAFIDNVIRDYRPLQAMTVELEFGDVRVFDFYIVGQIYTKKPVSIDVGNSIIESVKEKLALFFAPSNRQMGQKPTVMEVVNVIRSADSRIDYFDAGSIKNPVINWQNCDSDYFNPISFARYLNTDTKSSNLRIAPECLIS